MKTVIVCGCGLAGNLAALSLANGLGDNVRIIQIVDAEAPTEDALYGNVTDPGAYNFLRGLGLDEPTLMLKTGSSFSFGTMFRNWLADRSWMQCHHSPLGLIHGVPLRHVTTRAGVPLEPLLVSAQAALAGRFAHPPADESVVLSRAEYGYQLDPAELNGLLDHLVQTSRVDRFHSAIETIEQDGDMVSAFRLENGETIPADLVIDATGTSRRAVVAAGGRFETPRAIGVSRTVRPSDTLGPPCRVVEADDLGWTGTAHLQQTTHTLRISAAGSTDGSDPDFTAELGHMADAWVGNCIAIGHAASVFEPLTPAPMMMLQRDIERLLELVPVFPEMSMERREFNRRFHDDVAHINLFHEALVLGGEPQTSCYWQNATKPRGDARLDRKIEQFRHRGVLTSYDLEPFNDEDWTIAHLGMGRMPQQHDRLAEGISKTASDQALFQLRQSIQQLVPKMPPHHIYVQKLKQYLEKQKHA